MAKQAGAAIRRLPVLLSLALAGACGERAPAARPSVLLVVADSLHARHLSGWGHARSTSPRLDALAAQGQRFERAYSQSSWTLPSVATLFTSLEQERHGLRTLEQRLPDGPSTLAELFASGGWRTAAVVQTPVLGSARGLRRGFGSYAVLPFGNQTSEEALERGVTHFEQAAGAPLFLYLHLAPPHMPYQPPPPFRGRFAPDPGAGAGDAPDGSIASCRRVHRAGLAPEHPDVVRLAALYDEHVAYADDLVGRLVERVTRTPSGRDLLLVVTSDHGEAFLQHGAQGHNAQVYEEMLHVPLVVVGHGAVQVPRGTRREVVSLLDLLPTLVEWCRLPAPRQTPQGVSLAPLLRGSSEPLEARTLHFSSRYKDDPRALELGLREGDLKLVLSGADDHAALFDLASDPHERRDLSAGRPEQTARLEARLRAWHAARVDALEADAPSEAEARALRELGYTDE